MYYSRTYLYARPSLLDSTTYPGYYSHSVYFAASRSSSSASPRYTTFPTSALYPPQLFDPIVFSSYCHKWNLVKYSLTRSRSDWGGRWLITAHSYRFAAKNSCSELRAGRSRLKACSRKVSRIGRGASEGTIALLAQGPHHPLTNPASVDTAAVFTIIRLAFCSCLGANGRKTWSWRILQGW